MREEILKAMIKAVDEKMTAYKSDFYHCDLCSLVQQPKDMPFFWSVNETHTSLLLMNEELFKREASKREYVRFNAAHNKGLGAMSSFLYFVHDGDRMFYYDGQHITEYRDYKAYVEMVRDYYTPYAHKLMDWMKENFADEAKYWAQKMPVHFANEHVFLTFMKLVRGENGNILLDIAKRFHKWNRMAVNSKVIIGSDFAPKSFSFSERTNGKWGLCGGIIYSDETNNWSMHT